MAAPEFIAQDSDGWRDDASVSAGGLQVVDRNTQWLRNERLPVVGSPFRLITATQVDDAVLPTWYAARWTLGQPLRYYVPSLLRGPDGTAKVDVVIGCTVTGEIDLVAINESFGPPTDASLDAAVAASSPASASLTSSDTSARMTVGVVPGRWNVIRVAFKSALDLSSPEESTGPPTDQEFWFMTELQCLSSDSLPSTSARWVALAASNGETVTIDDARPFYTAAHIRSTGGIRAFTVAEATARNQLPQDATQARQGTAYWGELGTCAVKSLSVDPNSRQHDQVDNARLRWRQGTGQALERMAVDVRAAHRARAPQYGLICDQTEIDTLHPMTWRQFIVDTTSGGAVAPTNETVASWTFRWRDSYGAIDSYMEVAWAAALVGADPTEVTWRAQILALNTTQVEAESLTESVAAVNPSDVRTARWTWETALLDREWAMRGQTHIADVGTFWTPNTLRLPTDALTDGTMYFVTLDITADATENRGVITVDGAACRLVLL